MLLSLAVMLPAQHAVAQNQQHVSFKVGSEDSKYTQQKDIAVGNVPGHLLRMFEIHRTFPSNAPTINGVKLKELWTRGVANVTNGDGTSTTYGEFDMDNGDKFFSTSTTVSQSVGPDKFTTTSAGPIIGGSTGKFAGITGTVRAKGTAEPTKGVSEVEYDIEYSVPK